MSLIEVFENQENQNVAQFNKIFKSTKLLGFKDADIVEIGELCPGEERRIKVGNSEVKLNLTQRKSQRRYIPKNAMPQLVGKKNCLRCGMEKSFSEFSPHKTSRFGLHPRCKACNVKSVMEWKSKNKAKVNESQNKRNAEKKLTHHKV